MKTITGYLFVFGAMLSLSVNAFAVTDTKVTHKDYYNRTVRTVENKMKTKIKSKANAEVTVVSNPDINYLDLQPSLACRRGYIEHDRYAHLGKTLIKRFSENKLTKLWDGPSDFSAICPEYEFFDQRNRINIWIYILNNMSYYESSCQPLIENPNAPNGTAAGLFQLPLNDERRYAHGCQIGDSLNGDRSMICALSILELQIANKEPLFSNNSYWAVLRPNQSGKSHSGIIRLNVDKMCQAMAHESGLPTRRQIRARAAKAQ